MMKKIKSIYFENNLGIDKFIQYKHQIFIMENKNQIS